MSDSIYDFKHAHTHTQADAINSFGCTPLHVACNNGQDIVVDILLQYKVSVNALNNKVQTQYTVCSCTCTVGKIVV